MSSSSDVVVDASPFDLPGRKGRRGRNGRADSAALCLHGLTGTPYEVRPLGAALAARGIRALGPALPGHNETPGALAATTHRDWLEAARSHLRALRADHERVFVVGLSMGGLLTLQLAAEAGPDAVVTVATPLRLQGVVPWLVPVLKYLVPFPKKRGSDIRDPEARRRHPGYGVMPLRSVHELMRLQEQVRPQLKRVRCPILVAHGVHDRTADPTDARSIIEQVGSDRPELLLLEVHDRTADPTDARSIIEQVGSDRPELLLLESSGHVVPVDRDGPTLARATAEFLVRRGSGNPGVPSGGRFFPENALTGPYSRS